MIEQARGYGSKPIQVIQTSTALTEIEMMAVMADRVRAGEPIHVLGPLDEIQAKMHADMVNRLMLETGQPVTVIHSPS